MRIALFHPGAMGSALAGELVRAGHEVRWVAEGRSQATRQRAEAQGLIAASYDEAVGTAEVVLCSCAPQGAVGIARQAAGFTGIYIEANPLGPESLRQVAEVQPNLVDGGVIGPPPGASPAETHLVLSGEPAATAKAQQLWAGTQVTPFVVGTELGAASAAKASYALFNKGQRALAALARGLAERHGVLEVLEAQSVRRGGALLADPGAVRQLGEVAWRFGPEFDEIAATVDAAGLEGDAIRGLRQIWTRLESNPGAGPPGERLPSYWEP